MMTVKRLKDLLEKIPNDATVAAYQGEDEGLIVEADQKKWWISTYYGEGSHRGFDGH